MINLLYNIGQVLGVTIIHSLWQGLLIYFVLRLIFSSVPSLSSAKKYNFSTFALVGMAGWFIYTFCVQAYAYDWNPATVVYASADLAALQSKIQTLAGRPDFKTTFYNSIKIYLPYVSIIYAIGLVVNLGKLAFALKNIRVIKKSIIKAENLQDRIDELCIQLNIRRRVQVAFSRLVDVPCVIGYIKPLLLLPITLTFQLSEEEIETIVLHELSHIKRNDYLVNIIQQIISVLLFFNPFAQLIGNIISAERENRCDDMVVEKTASPLTYAYALLKLEEVRQTEVRLALAATQNKHHLLNRIERIMKTKTPIGNIRPILVALVLIAGSLSVAWLNPEVKNGKVTFKKIAAIRAAEVAEAAPVAKPVTAKHRHKKITVSYDTLKNQVTDTTKKKIKIVVEDENGNKHEYNSVKDLPEGDKQDFYKDAFNNSRMNFNFDMKMDSSLARMNKFYQSDKWKKQVADMQAKAEAMGKKFNSEAFKKQAATMDKFYKSDKWKKQTDAMAKEGDKMAKMFDSPEWKKKVDEMAKSGDNVSKLFDSPEWQKQVEEMAKSGAEMAKMYDNPEWKKQIEEMAKQGADMAKAYDSPEWKKQMEEISKQATEMAKHAGDYDMNFNFNSDDERAEKKERAERKERPEKKERIEKKERVEKKEAATAKKSAKIQKIEAKQDAKAEKPEKKERLDPPAKPEKPEAPEQPEN